MKQTSTDVRSAEILVYLVGGNPKLAKMLLQWIMCADDGDAPVAEYVFDDEDVILQHQGHDDEPVLVNTRECMKYLTALADPNDLLKDPLIVDEKALWFEMGSADVVVDLFDTSTWSGNDYERLLDLVHKRIVTHPLHQQRCESHVQMAALTASNNVGEGRRSDQAAGLSHIMRPFNRSAAETVNKSRKEKAERALRE